VSVGVALAGAGESDEAVVARADEALYEVKRLGRDGVRLAPAA
jgi:GGDEF domain-containing protein